jgi:hypothetical protein
MSRATSSDLWKPSTTAASILGETIRVGGRSEDTTLFYVDSGGAWAGSVGTYKPAATDVAILQYADSGPLDLQYVKAGAAIAQGQGLEWSGTPGQVDVSGAGGLLAGVALADVANASYFWMATAGSVLASIDAGGAAAAGSLLLTAAAGVFDETGAVVTNTALIAEDAQVGAGLSQCRIRAKQSI